MPNYRFMRNIFTVSLFVFCVYAHLNATAQTKSLDSLIAELPTAKEDTNKTLLLCDIAASYFETNPDKGIEYGKQALKLATKLDYNKGIVKANNQIARCNVIQNKYAAALKYYQDALVTAEKMNNPVYIAVLLSSIGPIYTEKKEYKKALDYLMRAKATYEKAGMKPATSLLNNIGCLYGAMKNNPEALRWLLEGVKNEEASEQPSEELERLYANAGAIYVLMRDYSKGMHYMFKALDIELKSGNEKSAAITYCSIGSSYSLTVTDKQAKLPDSLHNKKKNLDKAIYFLRKSEQISKRLGMQAVYKEACEELFKAYKEEGNFRESLMYFERFTAIRDSLRDFDKEKEFAKVEAKYLYQKKTDSLKFQNLTQQTEIKRRKSETKLYILLSILIALIGVIAITGQRRKHQQKIALAEAEANHKILLAQKELETFAHSIQEKNELIEKFGKDLEKYQGLSCIKELPVEDTLYTELKNSVILTEEQWNDFQNMFEQAYPGYLNRVKTSLPDLTKAELRHILLAKLALNNKEMASMLGVSLEAIRINKYRILKKLTLPEGTTIEQFVQSI